MGFFDTLSDITSGVSSFAQGLAPIASIAGAGYDIYQGIKSSNLADKYADISFASAEEQNKYAKEMFERQKSLYWPLEQQQADYTKAMLGIQQQYDPTLAAAQAKYSQDMLGVQSQYDPALAAAQAKYSQDMLGVQSQYDPALAAAQAKYSQDMLGVQQQYDPSIKASQAQYLQSMLNIQNQIMPNLTYLQGIDTTNQYLDQRKLTYAQSGYAVERGLADIEQQRKLDPTYRETETSLIRKLTEGEDVLANRMRTQAESDVSSKYAAQRQQDLTSMGIAGIAGNSQQYANYLTKMGQSEALASATAQNQATTNAENLALSRQAQALNYRKGASLPTSQYTPTAQQYTPTSQQYTRGTSQYTPTAQQYTPTSQQYTRGTSQYSPTVGTSNITGGSQLYGSSGLSSMGNAGSMSSGIANMYGGQAQQSFTGAGYLLKQFMGGNQ